MTVQEYILSQLSHIPLKRKDLNARLYQEGFVVSDRALRLEIESLALSPTIETPIGTSTRGYFIINSDELAEEAIKELSSKARTLFKRANVINKKWQKTKSGNIVQLTFSEFLQD